jgi:hypothetical protein
MAEKKEKVVWEDDVACSHCNKNNHIKVVKEVLVPAEPAQTELKVFVTKSDQAEIEEFA